MEMNDPHCRMCGARVIEGEIHVCDPEQSDELKDAIEAASVDLSPETAELRPQDQLPAQAGVVAAGPVPTFSGEPGSTISVKAPLFDEPTFDVEKAWHEVVRKSESVRLARSSYEAAKEEASDKKKVLDTRSKELEDLIKELQWKEQRAEQAKREPKLVPAAEATDGVEGMGDVPAEDPLDGPDDEPLDEESEGEEREDGLGSLADA